MNLLTDEQKNVLNKGLKNRFFVVTTILISFSILASAVMLVPSYLASKIELEDLLSQTIFTANSSTSDVENVLQLPKDINSKIKFIKNNSNYASAFSIITMAVSNKPVGVSINSISSIGVKDGNKTKVEGVILSGIAKDRKSLLDFSKSLEDDNNFARVDVPVNSLTKETNLPFSISLSISK